MGALWHWLTHDYWGGFVLGVVGNLIASALLTIPVVVRQARKVRAQAHRHHQERCEQHLELIDRLERHESHHSHTDGTAVGQRDPV